MVAAGAAAKATEEEKEAVASPDSIFERPGGVGYAGLTAVAVAVCAVLAPVLWEAWVVHGSGNANFYYAVGLAVAVAQVVWLGDVLGVVLTRKA